MRADEGKVKQVSCDVQQLSQQGEGKYVFSNSLSPSSSSCFRKVFLPLAGSEYHQCSRSAAQCCHLGHLPRKGDHPAHCSGSCKLPLLEGEPSLLLDTLLWKPWQFRVSGLVLVSDTPHTWGLLLYWLAEIQVLLPQLQQELFPDIKHPVMGIESHDCLCTRPQSAGQWLFLPSYTHRGSIEPSIVLRMFPFSSGHFLLTGKRKIPWSTLAIFTERKQASVWPATCNTGYPKLSNMTMLYNCQLFFVPLAGRGLCAVDRAMGQALWRGVTLSHDHPVHPRQLLLGQPGGQWLPTRKLPLAGCGGYFWAVELSNSAVKILLVSYFLLLSTDFGESSSSSCADNEHTPKLWPGWCSDLPTLRALLSPTQRLPEPFPLNNSQNYLNLWAKAPD